MTKPITPSEITQIKRKTIPKEVFEVVNLLLSQKFNGNCAIIKQNEIVDGLTERGFELNEIFDKHFLDFETLYGEAGWIVTYDKPGYNESYNAFFEFKIK